MEDERMLISVKGVRRVNEYPKLDSVPVSDKRIIDLVLDNASEKDYFLRKNVEIVIPSLSKDDNLFKTKISKEGLKVEDYHYKNYTIYDDFYTFTGTPYTDEAKDYLAEFNKFYVSVKHLPDTNKESFAIWYRNIPE